MYGRLMMAVALTALAGSAPGRAPVPPRVPVVVELFTSEGCSSCPPADAVLSKLAQEGAVAGVQVIPLGLHVTYWDQLGWKDPASLPEATDRQQGYGRSEFGVDNVYTPQAVVDGRTQLVGSDEAGLRRAIAKAAVEPHATITVDASANTPDRIVATVTVTKTADTGGESLHVLCFLTEDGLTSVVKRGENGGRTLHHDAVVRRVVSRAEKQIAAEGPPVTAEFAKLPSDWRRDRLHVVALVQGDRSHRVWAAATTAVPEIRH
jgi:hypothetical protein